MRHSVEKKMEESDILENLVLRSFYLLTSRTSSSHIHLHLVLHHDNPEHNYQVRSDMLLGIGLSNPENKTGCEHFISRKVESLELSIK